MKSKILVAVSILLNVGLLAVILQSLRARPVVVADVQTNRVAQVVAVATTNIEHPQPANSGTPVVEEFNWSQLVSTDFKIYCDNLRAIHCPEQTVRDIITSEINEYFWQKRRGYSEQLQLHFWEFAAHSRPVARDIIGVPDLENNEYSKTLEELSQARRELIEEVLGKDPSDAEERKSRLHDQLDEKYAWLPVGKREQMIALEEKYNQESQFDRRTPEAQAHWDKLSKGFQDAQKQLLSPDEFEEFQFRNSGSSEWAARLSGLEVNEAEWRAVGKLLMKRDEALKGMSPQASANAVIQAETESQIKATLGEERYAQYQLAKDNDYQQTLRIMKRYDLPDGVALQAHQMQQTAIDGANQIRANSNLSPETKQAALTAIQQETERSLNVTLGQKVFGTYQKYNGGWLNQLSQLKKSE